MQFLLTDSPQKLKLEKINGTLIALLYIRPSSLQLQRILFFYYIKQKTHSSSSDWWEYTNFCFEENARTFSKNSTTQKNITISILKNRIWNFYKKENFKPETKPMIENLQDELYQLESKL